MELELGKGVGCRAGSVTRRLGEVRVPHHEYSPPGGSTDPSFPPWPHPRARARVHAYLLHALAHGTDARAAVISRQSRGEAKLRERCWARTMIHCRLRNGSQGAYGGGITCVHLREVAAGSCDAQQMGGANPERWWVTPETNFLARAFPRACFSTVGPPLRVTSCPEERRLLADKLRRRRDVRVAKVRSTAWDNRFCASCGDGQVLWGTSTSRNDRVPNDVPSERFTEDDRRLAVRSSTSDPLYPERHPAGGPAL